MQLPPFQKSFLQRKYQQQRRAAGGQGHAHAAANAHVHSCWWGSGWGGHLLNQATATSGAESKHGTVVAAPCAPHLSASQSQIIRRIKPAPAWSSRVGGGGGGATRSRTRKRRRGGAQVTRWLTSTSRVATLSMSKAKHSPRTTSPMPTPRARYRPVGVRGEGRKLMLQQGQSRLATRTLFTAAQQAPMQAKALCTQPSRLAGPALHATTCTLKIPVQGKLTRAGQAGRR